ncbi:MAG TPA: lysine 5,6-aminomutase subunit alpha [Candidatus Limnocylindrales bacterium]|nr:lysine 5,6-aminomutase subunit alpha [Candidatus Limnocylindrales bacterium]
MSLDRRAIDRLVDLADVLAGAWSARARASTTPGCERALLRLAGVNGLDRNGRPLAWSVVDRYLTGRPERLPGGILSAFAVAALEYEAPPQDLALDVSAGTVDLGLEAELLAHPDRRADAEAEIARWAVAALDRIDANRTARRELVDVLGDPAQPWIAATVTEPEADDALVEARSLVAAGADLVRVDVPAGRELHDRLQAVGIELEPWHARPDARRRLRDPDDVAPAGSQRGLGRLREALDEAAAERRSFVRIGTSAPPLAAPEQAVVAAFERIDVIEADAMADIVDGIDPDRALADHAFAQRLTARAGGIVLAGAGPLVVGPDFARGTPSSAAILAGRALALQLVGVAMARANGVPAAQIVVGAIPPWVADAREPTLQAIAGVALRRRLFPDYSLAFDEPPLGTASAAAWPFLVSASLPAAGIPSAGGTALVIARSSRGSDAARIGSLRAAVRIGMAATGALAPPTLSGVSAEHADLILHAARDTLDRLANEGWRSVVGDAPAAVGVRGLGAGAVAERTDTFDPLAVRAPA